MKRLVLMVVLAGCAQKTSEPVRVAAAADLTEVFAVLGPAFEAKTKTTVTFSFGSSGLLAKQIAEGGPFDVFAAANRGFAEQAVTSGACDAATLQDYARGKLALLGAKLEALSGDSVKRIAIANPEHAPYGLAAKQALEHAGLWESIQPKVVFAENVRQALQFKQSGNVDAAFVALSNVIDEKEVSLVDPNSYQPLRQALVRCARGKNTEGAAKFVEFLGTREADEALRRFGFER